MPLTAPFAGVPARIAWLRGILLSASLLGMLLCVPVWLNGREYPLMPVASWAPIVPPPWDRALLAALLGALVLAPWRHRPAVIFFLGGTFFLFLGDQTRCQPWFYMYWMLLLLTLAPESTALAACRVALSAIYVWAGLQKISPTYFRLVPAWYVQPAEAWLPAGWTTPLQWLVAAAPAIEMFIGLGLWWARSRPWAIGAAVAMHASALLVLGPLGHKHNMVVWPWNVAMAALVVNLFPRGRLGGPWQDLRRFKPALVLVSLFSVLPVLSFFGRWDSYPSFSLYSGSLATADIYITDKFRQRLSPKMQEHVHALTNYNPQVQGPYVFDHQGWAMDVLGVPPLPEPRGFRVMARHLTALAGDPRDVKMVLAPRRGPVLLLQGEKSWVIEGMRK